MQSQGFGQNVATQFRRRTVALSAVVIKLPQTIEGADGGNRIESDRRGNQLWNKGRFQKM